MKRFEIILVVLLLPASALALDPRHDASRFITCNSCHTLHSSPGAALTKTAGISNLCLSCHTSGDPDNTFPIEPGYQASPGTMGTHHNFTNNVVNTTYQSVQPVSQPSMDKRLDKTDVLNPKITCAVCHDGHTQSRAPFDPSAPSYGGAGTGFGRHQQRIVSSACEMCVACHTARDVTDVKAWNAGSTKSHPVNVVKGTAPKDASGNDQTGAPRYAGNGAGDTNATNNFILDASGKVRCLSCHCMHFCDSNETTVDDPGIVP